MNYVIFIFNFKINTINILNTISHYNFSCGRYLFTHPKHEARRVLRAWPVAGTCIPTQDMKRGVYRKPEVWSVAVTCFLTQNMKPDMYLRPGLLQVPVFLPQI